MTGPSSNPRGERCCVCGSPNVTYRNYREQPFCWPCADCQCGLNPCVRETLYKPAQPTSRPRVDQLTDDQLDQLYTDLDQARAYAQQLLDNGAKAVNELQWARHHAEERAEKAEAELAALKTITTGYCPHCGRGDCSPTADQWAEQRHRAEKAEAAITRVRALAEELAARGNKRTGNEQLLAARIIAALDGTT